MLKVTVRSLLLGLFLVGASLVAADTGSPGLKPDVRLLIDISGSMKQSDPDNLRGPALDLIVHLLPEGAWAGVWLFGESVQELVPHGQVDAEWRRAAEDAVSNIHNNGLYTNIPLALEAATYDLPTMKPGYRTSIVLLTDGKVDVAESPMANADASRKVLEKMAPLLSETGVTVHTVALSDEADWPFLRQVARETGGIAEAAQDPEQLTGIFLQALEMVAPAEQVPLKGSSFAIDASVREFSALVFHGEEGGELALQAPDGSRFSASQSAPNVRWFSNRRFSLVTVRDPQAGQWQMVGPVAGETRITVIADLKLEVDPLPNSLPAGRAAELGLRLRDQDGVLKDPEVLAAFHIELQITDPAGEQSILDVSDRYDPPANGEYRVQLARPSLPGRYEIRVRVNGNTFQREIPMYMEVLPEPESASVNTRAVEEAEEDYTVFALGAAGLAVLLLLIYFLVQMRRRKRLDAWRRRYENSDAPDSDNPAVAGMSADRERD